MLKLMSQGGPLMWLILLNAIVAVAVFLEKMFNYHRAQINTSDFIGQVSLTAYKDWNLEAGVQWNPAENLSERSQFRLQYRPDGGHVVNLAYRAQRDRLEQEVGAARVVGPRVLDQALGDLNLAQQ